MTKPAVFIGSSSEGLPFARAAKTLLEADAEITLWNEGLFQVGRTFIETLVSSLSRFDFAILAMTPDDMVVSRAEERLGPRDNVLFELGLFMGRLGRERTLMLLEASSQLKVPSDLSGVIAATYRWSRGDSDHAAALAAPCDAIRSVIKQLGVVDTRVAAQVQELRSRQDSTESEVRALQVAMKGLVTVYEHEKLLGLAGEAPFWVSYSHRMYEEIRRLHTLGYVKTPTGQIDDLRRLGERLSDRARRHEHFDLKDYVTITAEGQEYVRIRSQLGPEDPQR
jgi:hypothetical protein